MDIVECNVPVKSAAAFFSGTCAPDALARYYNPFGKYFPDVWYVHCTSLSVYSVSALMLFVALQEASLTCIKSFSSNPQRFYIE